MKLVLEVITACSTEAYKTSKTWYKTRVQASTIIAVLVCPPLCSEFRIQSTSSKISWFRWFTSLSHHIFVI